MAPPSDDGTVTVLAPIALAVALATTAPPTHTPETAALRPCLFSTTAHLSPRLPLASPSPSYPSDDGDLTSLRYDNWKLVFKEQRAPGTLAVWGERGFEQQG